MFETPILLIIFNRPNTTLRVLEAIRQVKPKKLYIAADGPRNGKEHDLINCKEAKDVVLQNIDWDCKIKTLFREKNLGCGLGVSGAINWFFTHEEQGIILEDDCFPSISFFYYCKELLDRYKNEKQVCLISGYNPLGQYKTSNSYIYSLKAGIWGWATWKRAWERYNYNIPEWSNYELKNQVLSKLKEGERKDFEHHMDLIVKGELDTWDFQWWFYRLLYNHVGIVPKFNLISNIGFGDDATHTFNSSSSLADTKPYELQFPLIHPVSIEVNKNYDLLLYNKSYSQLNPLVAKIRKFIRALYI